MAAANGQGTSIRRQQLRDAWGIAEHMYCAHEQRELRRRIQSNGTIAYVHQCLICGTAGWPVPYAKVEGSPPPFDYDLAERFYKNLYARLDASREAARREERQEESGEWWSEYRAYLLTPEWRERRRLVMERADGMCEGCRLAYATQVHHLSYEHVGHELLYELVAVCDDCHDLAHGGGEDDEDWT